VRSNDEISARFDELDRDGNGMLSQEEVTGVLQQLMGFDQSMDMGPVCWTPNPTQSTFSTTQPNPTFFEQTTPDPTQASRTDTVQRYRTVQCQ